MRKQTKLAVILAAAALLTLGAIATLARGWVQVNGRWYYEDANGEYVTNTIQASGSSKFYLGEDGAMVTDTFVEDYSNNNYYFGSNGAMVVNTWVAVDPSVVSNTNTDNPPSAYWYYFQSNGKAYKATTGYTKKTIDGKKYAFNEYGQMLTGWINGSGEVISEDEDDPFKDALFYGGGENDGVLRTGWHTYTDGAVADEYSDLDVVWVYFNTNCEKNSGNNTTKKINGKTYLFDENGVMQTGWQDLNENTWSNTVTKKYYSDENDGHLVKKGWIYEVPDKDIDEEDSKDEEYRWFYAGSSGEYYVNGIKKVNSKYYAFDKKGIMKTGLVIVDEKGEFYNTINLDYTNGYDLTKLNTRRTKDQPNGTLTVDVTGNYKVHYFVSNGERQTGTINIDFADDTYTFVSDNNGGFKGYKSSQKKYYTNGLLLKADKDIKYGIVYATSSTTTPYKVDKDSENLIVVTSAGAKAATKPGFKKDGDGNYWVLGADSSFVRIVTCEVRYSSYTGVVTKGRLVKNQDETAYDKLYYGKSNGSVFQFKSTFANVSYSNQTFTVKDEATTETFRPFTDAVMDKIYPVTPGALVDSSDVNGKEVYGKLDVKKRGDCDFELDIYTNKNASNPYTLNFTWNN
ncbi:MAG: hypothetical protein Q4F88_00375 [Eubacteriales bacterium]|nr:hypothetical protein [Eubacteriales bacterium]